VNENEVAERIIARLDRGLADLPPPTVQKLHAARLAAVAAYRPGKPAPHPASGAAEWGFGRVLGVRLALSAAIVIASITGLIYWQTSSHHEDELDTGLLAGELPLHAYTDPGFETWVKHSNYEQSRP
jgi:hypothetical protein